MQSAQENLKRNRKKGTGRAGKQPELPYPCDDQRMHLSYRQLLPDCLHSVWVHSNTFVLGPTEYINF